MELKQKKIKSINSINILLIVPYGIETPSECQTTQHPKLLLIVPYGIETILLQ